VRLHTLADQGWGAGVTELVFGPWFDLPLEVGVLPERLTKLRFGKEFNQKISYRGCVSSRLEVIDFSFELKVQQNDNARGSSFRFGGTGFWWRI
jgi:hypothetical protein